MLAVQESASVRVATRRGSEFVCRSESRGSLWGFAVGLDFKGIVAVSSFAEQPHPD